MVDNRIHICYLLFLAVCTEKNTALVFQETEPVHHEGGNHIQQFDTEGNPLKEYILDRYITGFCIDEANDRFRTKHNN